MATAIRLIDRIAAVLSHASLIVAGGAILLMIAVTLYEVGARYLFNAPTLFAFDLAWMLNGAAFTLAAAYTLRIHQHVAIDVFSKALPERVRHGVYAGVLLLLFLPAVLILADAAWDQTVRAYVRGEIERVSPWKPLIWPFRAALAVALSCLAVETLAQGLKAAVAAFGSPDPSRSPITRDADHG